MRLANLQMIVDPYETKVEEYHSLLFMEGRAGQCWEQLWKRHTGGSDSKEFACNAEDLGLILRSGRSLGEGNGNPLRYSCLGNPTDRGAWWATVHGTIKNWTQLSTTANSP